MLNYKIDEKMKSKEVSRILIDANYELIKQNIKEKKLLNDIFDGDFHIKINFKPERAFNFTDLKTVILRNLPNLERGIALCEEYALKLEKHYSFLFTISQYNNTNLLSLFCQNLDRNLMRVYEKIDAQLAKNFNASEESGAVIASINETNLVPEELRICHFQNKLRTKIISFSNELNSIANITNVSNKSVIDFVAAGEKILALYHVLRSEESGAAQNIVNNAGIFAENYKVNLNLMLTYMCSNKPFDVLYLLQLDDESFVRRLIENFYSYSFTNPENIHRIHDIKKGLISDLHKIISDKERTNEELTCYSRKNFKHVVASVFQREKNRIHIEVRSLIQASLNKEGRIFTGEKEFDEAKKHLEAEMGRMRRQLELLRQNEFYQSMLKSNIKPMDITLMTFSEENVKKLTGIEKLMRDLIESTKDQKNLAELIYFTHKEEEVFFKTKLFEVVREAGNTLYDEFSRNNLNQLIEDLFARLVESVNKFHAVDENSLEEKIYEEMQRGKGAVNPYLMDTLQAISGLQFYRKGEPPKGLHNYEKGYVDPRDYERGYVDPRDYERGYAGPRDYERGYVDPRGYEKGYVDPRGYEKGYGDPREREIARMERLYSDPNQPSDKIYRNYDLSGHPRDKFGPPTADYQRTRHPGELLADGHFRAQYPQGDPAFRDTLNYKKGAHHQHYSSQPRLPVVEGGVNRPFQWEQRDYDANLRKITEAESGGDTRGRYGEHTIKHDRGHRPDKKKHKKHY